METTFLKANAKRHHLSTTQSTMKKL